jgi:membrane protein implicated in regulation of membrane protease activity
MSDLTLLEIIYWASAIIGGTLFILRTIMIFSGIGADDGHVDLHADDIGDIEHGGDMSINLLSLQGLTAFFTMFGLIGLTLYSAGVHPLLTILGASAAGLFTVFVISWLFTLLGRFQSEGTLDINNAVGATGTVYLRIPNGGTGQVQISIQGGLRIIDALAAVETELPTGTKVTVVGVRDSTTLVVEKHS